MIYFLDFRGRNVGGPVLPGRLIGLPGVASGTEDDLRRETRIIFLVHGFNVNRQNGQAALRQLAGMLTRSTESALVAVTWPGDSWAKAAGYPLEGNDADDTARELVRFADRVVQDGAQLSFVSHSMGGRVVMETIKRLPPGRFAVSQACVMAAAVDDFSLAWGKAYLGAVQNSGRVTVLASQSDKVLRFAYPAGDFLQSFLFFWKDVAGKALGLRGPRAKNGVAVPVNVHHEQIPDGAKVDHGDYISGNPGPKHVAAGKFADAALAGEPKPVY
ncbi:MAG: alpha/beta fold hydrolase [Gemmatimonadota bacterium]